MNSTDPIETDGFGNDALRVKVLLDRLQQELRDSSIEVILSILSSRYHVEIELEQVKYLGGEVKLVVSSIAQHLPDDVDMLQRPRQDETTLPNMVHEYNKMIAEILKIPPIYLKEGKHR